MQTWQAIHKLASILETMQENSLNHRSLNLLGAKATGNSVIDALSEYAEQIGFEVIPYGWGFEVRIYGFTCGGVRIEEHRVDNNYIKKYRVFTKRRRDGISEDGFPYMGDQLVDLKVWLKRCRDEQERYSS